MESKTLWLKGRVICESCAKYFIYELSNCLVSLTLISIVELVSSISSRPNMNHPTKRLITQDQSNLCLYLFVATVPILNIFYLCSIYLGGIIVCLSHQDLWGVLLLFFCNVEQSMYIENSTDLILPHLKVNTIFSEYRNVIKMATCFHGHDDYKQCSVNVCRKCE